MASCSSVGDGTGPSSATQQAGGRYSWGEHGGGWQQPALIEARPAINRPTPGSKAKGMLGGGAGQERGLLRPGEA